MYLRQGASLPLRKKFAYVCSSTGVDCGLQTRKSLVYWSHSYSKLSKESGGLPSEKFPPAKLSLMAESASLKDKRDGKSSVLRAIFALPAPLCRHP